MKKLSKLFAITLALAGLIGFTQPAEAAGAGASTRNFVQAATVSNGFEIMASRMAVERSRNPEVRDFARMMIDAHSRADDELRDALRHSSYRMRNMPNDLDGKHRSMLNRLERMQGPGFDQTYISYMRSEHSAAVALFARYARSGPNPALREYANTMLPEIREHQEHVREIRLYR
jgi:putative membrane protein